MGGVIHPLHQVDLLTPAERKITEKNIGHNAVDRKSSMNWIRKWKKMESHQRKHVTRQKNNFFVTLLMMLQAPPNHQRNFQKSLMKNITSSSRSVETDTAIFTLAEKIYHWKESWNQIHRRFSLESIWENTKSHREQKEEILEQQSPNTSTDLPTVPFSDTSAISTPFIFIKSDLRLVIDLQTCIKAQQSGAYAQK